MNVDIVIVTFRSADGIEACLHSIPRRDGIRVIVVENHSGDETPELARRAGAEVIESTVNLGFGQAANEGARRGAGDAILFLNPDALLRPDTLDRMLQRFESPDVAIVGATLRYPDGREQRSWWPYPSATDLWAEAFGVKQLRGVPSKGFVVGACFLVRRTVFESVGGFDSRYWLYGEEADLCFRVEQTGNRVVLADDAICDHESGGSDRESSTLVAEHFALGSDRFVALHRGAVALFSYRVAGLVGSLIRWPLMRLRSADDPRVAVRARQIRRTIRVLLHHPFSIGPVERPDRIATRSIVLLSLEAWDDVWRRNQLIVDELLQMQPDLRVLWVEPPDDVLHEARRRRRLPRLRPTEPGPVPGHERVVRVRPRKILPRAVWPFADRSLARQVRRAMRREGFDDAVLWVNDSTYVPLVAGRTQRAIYDITDDWLDASGAPREVARRTQREHAMLELADAVVVCSPELERRRSAVRHVELIPNAVDGRQFRSPQPRPADLPAGSTAVYVGTLHDDRIDVGLVATIAEQLPGTAFVLVGPQLLSDVSTARLTALANVHLLGPRPYSEVPAYLQHADVVIVPHVISPFTQSLDPIKAYECLAIGRPTLATPVAGFTELGAPVETIGREQFADRLRELLAEARPTVQVSVPSWTDRATAFAAVLDGSARPAEPEPAAPAAPKKLHVAFVGHTAVVSGGEIALARLLGGLASTEAHVLLGEDGPIVPILRDTGATVEILPMGADARTVKRDSVQPGRLPVAAARATVGYVLTLRKRLRELDPDVVHTNTLKAAIYGGVAGRLAGVPVVWHVRDRIADDYLPAKAVTAIRLLARVLPSAIITNSRATEATLGRATTPGSRVLHAVVHDPLPAVHASTRPATTEPLIAIIGRIAPWKGQDVFLRAFAIAFPNGGATAIVVGAPLFGETDFETALHDLARELGVADRVTFTGHRSDVPELLGEVDIVVHASVIPEPFGQVVIEAMAAGRAVVASAAGGPLEIITDNVDGRLVPPGDPAALAAVMQELAADPARRAALGLRAVERARDFDPARIGAEIERIHRRVARRRD